MSAEPLLSAVLVLRYHDPFRSGEKYMGRAAQKIALGLLSHINADLVTELHDQNDVLPLTISDLFQSDAHHHWLRVTALRHDVVDLLDGLLQHPADELSYDGWTLLQALDTQHDWTGRATTAALMQHHWRAQRRIKLEFASATSVKSQGLHRPFPDPVFVMRSLYTRWQRLSDLELPFAPSADELDAFLMYGVEVTDFRLRSVRVPIKQNYILSFRGTANYHVVPPSKILKRHAQQDDVARKVLQYYDDFCALFNLLTAFAFYAGVGVKTAQGMGMTRRLD